MDDRLLRKTEAERPRVAITLGDANGIGPEVILKSLADEALFAEMQSVIVGSGAVLEAHAQSLGNSRFGVRDSEFSILEVGGGSVPAVQFGKTTEAAGALAIRAIEKAVDLCLDGSVNAMVTAPISKEAVRRAGFAYPGHTEYIAERTGSGSHMMMMVSDALRVGLVSAHVPLREAPAAVTPARILEKLRVLDASLRRDFGIDAPEVAVLGLNPHAGDGGVIGKEEIEVIVPALEAARAEGLPADGPFPADGFFGARRHEAFDAVLATYHDQGLVPFKTLSFGRGVNFTAGLPIVRTSPDHGTAFDIAGQGTADPGSMKAALRLAADVARRRMRETTDDRRPRKPAPCPQSKIENPKSKIRQTEPYSALAAGYDAVMAHVDYDFWADHVQALIEQHHPVAEAILELGCGTGSLALRLQPRGPYAYLATDGSADMLRVARKKARGKLIRFRQADFSGFAADHPADVVLLLYDGMNYLLEEAQVRSLLACAHAALQPGGIFLFDQSTPVNSAEEGFEYTGQAAGFTFVRRSHYDSGTHLHTTTLELSTSEDTCSEEHVQRAYTLAEVRRLVRASAFTEVAAYDGFTADAASDASARVHWVLRRRAGETEKR